MGAFAVTWWPSHIPDGAALAAAVASTVDQPWVRGVVMPLAVALIAGGVVMYGANASISEQVAGCRENMQRLERQIDQIRADIYRPQWQGGLPLYQPEWWI